MPTTYVYKIPLFQAYTYSLVREGSSRPDELDEEGQLHQILTYDDEGRLIKAESCVNGEINVEKNIYYVDSRIGKETERFLDSGGETETVYRYRDDGFVKEYYIGKDLDAREVFTQEKDGPVTVYRKTNANDETVEFRETDEHGNIIRSLTGGREYRFDFTYDSDGRITRKRTRTDEEEMVSEYRYNADGLLTEETFCAGEEESRTTYLYERGELVKEETMERGVSVRIVEHRVEAGGTIRIREEKGKDDFRRETIEETNDSDRYRVMIERSKEPLYDGRGDFHRHLIQAGTVEIIYDADRRITDLLACDRDYRDAELGIECDANAYYFFEYEKA